MPLESANYIHELNASYPDTNDPKSEGDDHIKMIKTALKTTFPNLTGAVTRTQNQLNKAPYDKSTLDALLNTGEKLVTARGVSSQQAADLSFGWDTAAAKIRAFISGVAVPDFDASGNMPNSNVIELGGKVKIFRISRLGYPSNTMQIDYPEELAALPFFTIVRVWIGYDMQTLTGDTFSSMGNPVTTSGTGTKFLYANVGNVMTGPTRFSVYVIGKVK